jgi:PAB-dependent poly(A)-specific ribonuclease subunit 3
MSSPERAIHHPGLVVQDFSSLTIDPSSPNMISQPTQEYMTAGNFQTGNEMMFQAHSTYPLQYHLYSPLPMGRPRQTIAPHERYIEEFFIRNSLREELQRKNEATLQKLPGANLPDYVHVYHSLVPLDTNIDQRTLCFGYPTWVYKAVSNHDGRVYCLRRIEGFRLTNEKAVQVVQRWRNIDSPSIVRLHEAFTTRTFGDNSLVLVYDYYPLATTLSDTYFGAMAAYQSDSYRSIDEQVLWNYIVQMITGLRAIHNVGLAARCLDPTRVVVTKKGRIRLNCCGIFDILQFDEQQQLPVVEDMQREDIANVARIILCLACKSGNAGQSVTKSLAIVSKMYSQELHDFLSLLLDNNNVKTVDEIISMLSTKFLDCMTSALYANDDLESELSKELENGRLVRLLCKFGFINERPEFDHDSSWCDSGDRYLIKLFRDYVFHQVDELGNPVVDMGHVLSCLNKLDAGVDDNILLVSRDEQNCLIVTYKELKSCLETAFRDLTRKTAK